MILLYGGSFDPVHRGHVDTARAAAAAVNASSVVWIPAALSPLKAGSVASGEQRRDMLQQMLVETAEPHWQLDDSELQSAPPSYTIHTLQRWRAHVGPTLPLAFLMGRDSLLQLPRWKDWQKLTDYAHLLIARRPDCDAPLPEPLKIWLENRQLSDPKLLQSRPFGSLVLLDTPLRPISSTDLRASLADQRQTEDWLMPGVRDYIDQHGLYREPENPASS
ncbi:nicotinate-nucleotide adenylyltransferase [Perlucidibaca aquatica]|uniref:nicotinate-nucleotide adenylyltransferase n=1 Tax=Perlucidibaca aquatica TaxID=1852776 RepID=UPI00083B13DB|nr:nicotinate-nucleotide adenylyltransferase [Perlucidibaca aquatica]